MGNGLSVVTETKLFFAVHPAVLAFSPAECENIQLAGRKDRATKKKKKITLAQVLCYDD